MDVYVAAKAELVAGLLTRARAERGFPARHLLASRGRSVLASAQAALRVARRERRSASRTGSKPATQGKGQARPDSA